MKPVKHISLLSIIVICFLAGCSKKPGTYKSGSYTQDTATKASKDPNCNSQTRIGEWASFATAYTYEEVRVWNDYNDYLEKSRHTSSSSGGLASFVLGHDPDLTVNFKTHKVLHRWGAWRDRALTYLSKNYSIAKNDLGIYLWMEDQSERRKMKISLLFALPNEWPNIVNKEKVSLKFQFVGGEPLFVTNKYLHGFGIKEVRNVAYYFQNPPGGSHESITEELYNYLFMKTQPSSLLTVEIRPEKGGDVIYKEQIDFRDARTAYQKNYLKYLDIVKRGCAR